MTRAAFAPRDEFAWVPPEDAQKWREELRKAMPAAPVPMDSDLIDSVPLHGGGDE